jgi:hypothetical protein
VGLAQAELSRLIAEVHAADMRYARVIDFIHRLSHGQTGRQARLWAMYSLIIMRSVHSLLMRILLMEATSLCSLDPLPA